MKPRQGISERVDTHAVTRYDAIMARTDFSETFSTLALLRQPAIMRSPLKPNWNRPAHLKGQHR